MTQLQEGSKMSFFINKAKFASFAQASEVASIAARQRKEAQQIRLENGTLLADFRFVDAQPVPYVSIAATDVGKPYVEALS